MKDTTNKSFWERFAFLYTSFMKKNEVCYDILAKQISPYLKTNMKVLELACGTGQLTFRLADLSKEWIATDYSENMITKAKERSNLANGRFEVADATNLQYKDAEFDIVLIANALHIMPGPESALKETARVLGPNGILIAPTFVYDKGMTLKIKLMEMAGFHTYHKWTSESYIHYISTQGYSIEKQITLPGNPLQECLVIARKSN